MRDDGPAAELPPFLGEGLPLGSAPLIGGGRYALVAKIAKGGMAGVYRAFDTRLRVWRAVKVLLPEYAARRTLRARFEAEAAATARIDHPNVIRVYDVRSAEVLPYLVMELATGGTLSWWLDRHGRMPAGLATAVVSEVAAGLRAAHAEGIVHRDVKPHNVLVTHDSHCKITDFGIAQVDRGDITRSGSTMGTIGYMAPEQRSDARLVDARADVYSLGAVLYKLTTGIMLSDLFLVEHEPSLLEEVPPALRPIVVRACHHDRNKRYASMAELADHVREVQATLEPDRPSTPPLASREPDDLDPSDLFFPEIGDLLEASAEERVRAHGYSSTPFSISSAPARIDGPAGELLPSSSFSIGSDAVAHVVEVEPARAPNVRWLAAAAVAAWMFVGLIGVLGSWDVSRRAAHAEAARDQVYAVIEEEDDLLAELGTHGAATDELAALAEQYTAFTHAEGALERRDAALRYATGVASIADRVLGSDPSDLTTVRAGRVTSRLEAWRAADRAWVDATRRIDGRLATALGLAPRP